MWATLLIAARNLVQHRRRSLLLGGALAAVTALLLLLGAIATGARAAMLQSATTLLTGHVNVGGFYKPRAGAASPVLGRAPEVLAEVRRLVPELTFAAERGRGFGKAISDRAALDVVLAGVDVSAETSFGRRLQMVTGDAAGLAHPGTLLLFEDQARRLGVGVGDAVTLSAQTPRGVRNTVDLRVVAVARSAGALSSFVAFLPGEDLRRLQQLGPGTTGALHLFLRDPAEAPAVAARLRAGLARVGWPLVDADPQPYWQKLEGLEAEPWTGQRLDVSTWEDELSFLGWVFSALRGLTGVLGVVLMGIVVVGITNTLWIAIRERTREIGTLRAIGMGRGQVLRLFLAEAALLALAGAAAGALAAAGLAAGLDRLQLPLPDALQILLVERHLALAVEPLAALRGAAVVVAVTTLAALYPALRAARLSPVSAMQHLG
ncbi:ABC transporter permease [Anaeromyxobacter diazotrophicus]|uniref:ABC3 transporter permease C-terminal domain-containing protein n=1 Tax=Anaeromyxobacter diazotrophicus TaxID=2590199 RepID=A0A7I9VNW6_9BACT|nr:FtsX-like permease family protein [Anaeromyxobacter diazotrophicus]GEJ57780.1 hypothetical protein AMYX_25210 [Anaeromyxobacter diazotrophicus]